MSLGLRLTKFMGSVCHKIQSFLMRPIAVSTWILILDMWRDTDTSCPESCVFPRVEAGMSSWTPFAAKYSGKLNPLSAMTMSPPSKGSIKPDDLVIVLSLALPPQKECDWPCWTNANQEFDGVVELIVGVDHCSCTEWCWAINEYLAAVYDTPHWIERGASEEGWKIPFNFFSWRPMN